MRDLLRHLNESLERSRELIFCQVVETRGSTPQKPGAVMLVDPAGGQAGTLGGGCVEAEVKQKAIRRIGQTGKGAGSRWARNGFISGQKGRRPKAGVLRCSLFFLYVDSAPTAYIARSRQNSLRSAAYVREN